MWRRRRRSAVSPRNVDPLRSTTYCGIRSTRKHRGNSFALNQQSCPASLSVTLVKLGGCCRTDGPRRALSCQMWHTITAINAAWCRSIRWASSRRASDSVSCEKFTSCSKRWILNRSWTQRSATDGSSAQLWCYACALCSRYPHNPPCIPTLYCCCANSGACLSCLGHYWPLRRRSVSRNCSVRCRPINKRGKNYRNSWSNRTFDKVHYYCHFSQNYLKSKFWRDFWRSKFLKSYFRTLICVNCKQVNAKKHQNHQHQMNTSFLTGAPYLANGTHS